MPRLKMDNGIDISKARQLGLEHGQQIGSSIDRAAVGEHFPRWTAEEIDAYLDGRRKGAAQLVTTFYTYLEPTPS